MPRSRCLQRRPPLGSRPVSIVLALLSPASCGVADFLGGTASRRLHALVVTLIAMVSGSVVIVVVCLAVGGVLTGRDVAWSAAAGVAGALALATFYSALAKGPMGVVAPLSAVTSAVVPVLVGLALGERPSTVSTVGVVLALPAIALVAPERRLPREPKRGGPPTARRGRHRVWRLPGAAQPHQRCVGAVAGPRWPRRVDRSARCLGGHIRRAAPIRPEHRGGRRGRTRSGQECEAGCDRRDLRRRWQRLLPAGGSGGSFGGGRSPPGALSGCHRRSCGCGRWRTAPTRPGDRDGDGGARCCTGQRRLSGQSLVGPAVRFCGLVLYPPILRTALFRPSRGPPLGGSSGLTSQVLLPEIRDRSWRRFRLRG